MRNKEICWICESPAAEQAWSPLWHDSHEGPLGVCELHRVTVPDKSVKHYLGHSAEEVFRRVDPIIPRTDGRYYNVVGMLIEHGQNLVCSQEVTRVIGQLRVNDGHVWLVTPFHVSHLGLLDDARELFPNLFELATLPVAAS